MVTRSQYQRRDGEISRYAYDYSQGRRPCLALLRRGVRLMLDPENGSRGWVADGVKRHFSHRTIAALVAAGVAIREGNTVRLA